MTDPDDLLRGIPDESPPPEIVVAAVRGFRYRAIAVVTSIIAAVFLATFALGKLGPPDLGTDAAAAIRGGADVIPVLATAEYDGIVVTFSEIVIDGDTGYIRLLFRDMKQHGEVTFEVTAIEVAGQRQEVFGNSLANLFSYRAPGGELQERTSTGGWFRFENPNGIAPPVVVEVQLLILTEDMVLEGSDVSGPYPTLRLESDGSP